MAFPRWILAASLAGTLGLVAAACGDSDSGSTAAEAEPATTMQAAAQQEPVTVVDVAAAAPDFSTLVTAVTEAGLVDTLSGSGPFTVFAPKNEAFAALPAGTLDSLLLPENRDQLASVLTYHVVPGKVLSGDLTDGMKVTTVQGAPLTVNVRDGAVTLTDGAGRTVSVVQPDVEAGNGVVHVVDAVLLPSAG